MPADRNILAIHDRIDEEHFEIHLLKQAVHALQQRVILLESEVRELRRLAFDDEDLRTTEDGRLVEEVPRGGRSAPRRAG
jgi:hypothetical protein